ncbi:hypothetical protein NDU88_006531 [Pleurodeles waltl]|uniref:Uncharacterized protein n=1 Tax=Pleurodeles waltl TaxID=8319 RepID=A0AAV7VRN0_PLEWA|nr:hypothetical protein NDU88_006531 [Pleurodeles waltl]
MARCTAAPLTHPLHRLPLPLESSIVCFGTRCILCHGSLEKRTMKDDGLGWGAKRLTWTARGLPRATERAR